MGDVKTNDDRIKQLMAVVEKQKEELGPKPRAKWNTNAVFRWPDGSFVNLNTIGPMDFGKLIDAMSFMMTSAGNRQEAADRLGVEIEPHKHGGFTIEEWEEDFKLRVAIVQYDGRKKKLDANKKKLKSLISEGTRTEMELDDIAAELGL